MLFCVKIDYLIMLKPQEHPSSVNIIKWAYQKPKPSTVGLKQDVQSAWDEAITTIDNADLLLTLALDRNCPRRVNILRYLYFLVGTSVSRHAGSDVAKIKELLETAKSSSDKVIINWVTRSRIILGDLRKFDYTEWCLGGFVDRDISIMYASSPQPQ